MLEKLIDLYVRAWFKGLKKSWKIENNKLSLRQAFINVGDRAVREYKTNSNTDLLKFYQFMKEKELDDNSVIEESIDEWIKTKLLKN